MNVTSPLQSITCISSVDKENLFEIKRKGMYIFFVLPNWDKLRKTKTFPLYHLPKYISNSCNNNPKMIVIHKINDNKTL